jgi:hypothetical protein
LHRAFEMVGSANAATSELHSASVAQLRGTWTLSSNEITTEEEVVLSALIERVPVAVIGERVTFIPGQAAANASGGNVMQACLIVQSATKSPPQGVTTGQFDDPLAAPALFPAPLEPEPEPAEPFAPASPFAPACAFEPEPPPPSPEIPPAFAPPAPGLSDESPQPLASSAKVKTAHDPNVEQAKAHSSREFPR